MTEKYDAVVVGLGPAGTVALWHLARMGFNVAGFDWRGESTIWGKPCGDAIGAHHFRNAGLPEPPIRTIKNRVKAIDIYSPGKTTRYRVYGEGYIIDRNLLGRTLLKDAADKGAVINYHTKVLEPILRNGKVTGIRVKKGEKTIDVEAFVVIEASGFSRVIKARLPSEWPVSEDIDERDLNIAYREIIEYNDYEIDEPEVIRIYLDQDVAPGGYWWFFPESRHSANIGLGVQGGMGYPNPIKIYKEKLIHEEPLSHNYRVINAAGAPVPTRRPANSLVGNGVLVVGDAGYTVNPVHGGGMGYSFHAAYLAAKSFEEAYNHGVFDEEGLWRLNIEYMRGLGAKQAALDVFRRFLQRLSNDEIRFGMERKLIPEVDVYEVSSSGDLKVSVVEKAMIVLRGVQRPGLLLKLKLVAEYMRKVREHYKAYPDKPSNLPKWINEVERLFLEFEEKLTR